jgi:hypothetical protein
MRTSGLLPLALVLAVSCDASNGPNAPDDTPAGFVIATYDEHTFEATLTAGAGTVRLLAIEVEPKVFDVTVDFGDPVMAYRIDWARGTGEFTATGPLDVVHNQLIDQLATELGEALPQDPDDRWKIEDVLMRQVALLQIAPIGESLQPTSFQSTQSIVHISCTCSYQYIGSGYYRTAGKGCSCTGGSGNGCKGRCGQGCGITSTPACYGSTAYTQDCAKHDYGLGSWASASDDFSFASNNCSCSGTAACY